MISTADQLAGINPPVGGSLELISVDMSHSEAYYTAT